MRLRARRDGGVELVLDPVELALLRSAPEQLRALYDAPGDDPARDRLFPRAYLDPTEEAAEREWQALARPSLLRDRLDALDRMDAHLDAATPRGRRWWVALAADDVASWAAVCNDVRLATGTRLGITDDTDLSRIAPDDPLGAEKAAYAWWTALQGGLVEAMLRALPD